MEKLIFSLTLMDNNEITEELDLEELKCLEEDLTGFFKELVAELLGQHRVHSEVINPACGCWYVNFSWKQDELPISEEEQIDSIIQAGEKLVREHLEEELEIEEIDFELVIQPLTERVKELDEKSRCKLILEQKTKNFSVNIKKEKLMEVIENHQIDIYLQPIFNLESKRVVGFEALARGPEDSLIYSPADLFGTANQYGLTEELELVCVEEAVKLLDDLPEFYWLSINLGPDLLKTDKLVDNLGEIKEDNLDRVVLELTEHLPLSDIEEMKQPIKSLQQKGISFALDDTGCGFANLEIISELQPELVKLCITIVNKLGRQKRIKDKIIQIKDQVTNLGGSVLGEGIEELEQFESLKETGVQYGQGYYFAKPAPAYEIINKL